MNIEEQIKIVKNMLLHAETQLLDYEALAIETLLTAYEKEKEKNKELEDTLKCTQNSWYEDTKVIEKQSKEIEELKRKEQLNKTINGFKNFWEGITNSKLD